MNRSARRLITAVLVTLPLPALAVQSGAEVDVGVAAAVNPAVVGLSTGRGERTLVVGNDIGFRERIRTSEGGNTQLLFVDQSNLTVGPGSELVIDEFVFDPANSTGKLSATVAKGVFRFVGGRISKKETVEFRTPTATIGIRGGVGTFQVDGQTGATTFILHFGKATVTNASGVVRNLTASGFKVRVAGRDQAPTPPEPATTEDIGRQLSAFDAQPAPRKEAAQNPPPSQGQEGPAKGEPPSANAPAEKPQADSRQADDRGPADRANPPSSPGEAASGPMAGPPGGPPDRPGDRPSASRPVVTDQRVADSPVGALGSANAPKAVAPRPVVAPIAGGRPERTVRTVTESTVREVGVGDATQPRPPSPPPLPPTEISRKTGITGRLHTPEDQWPNPGGEPFTNAGQRGLIGLPGTDSDISLTDGTLFADRFRSTMRAGTGETATFELPAGDGYFAVPTTTIVDLDREVIRVSGSGYVSPNGDFLSYWLHSDDEPDKYGFLFAGVPTPEGGRLNNLPQLMTYRLRDDFIQKSPIPFALKDVGGDLANPAISPVLVVTRAGSLTNADADVSSASILQASLAIDGEGSGQKSLFLGAVGGVRPADQGTHLGVALEGVGSFRLSAGQMSGSYTMPIGSVADAGGNHFFGPTLDHLVLTQTTVAATGTAQSAVAFANPPDQSANAFGFHHVADREAGVSDPGTRTSRTMTGFAAGVGEFFQTATVPTPETPSETPSPTPTNATFFLGNRTNQPTDLSIRTDAGRNAVVARFDLSATVTTDPSLSTQLSAGFGGVDQAAYRGAFIDDSRFGAVQSDEVATTVAGGQPQRVFSVMASSGVVPREALPGGVRPCTCEFLSWGWWSSEIEVPETANTLVGRNRIHLATWVAGEMADEAAVARQTGTASYAGHAIGTVLNGNDKYVAAGRLQATYDFGSRVGTVNINNFDGQSYAADVVPLADSARVIGGSREAANGTLRVSGAFFRGGSDPVKGIGGQFTILGDRPGYVAAGTFAGQKAGVIAPLVRRGNIRAR